MATHKPVKIVEERLWEFWYEADNRKIVFGEYHCKYPYRTKMWKTLKTLYNNREEVTGFGTSIKGNRYDN